MLEDGEGYLGIMVFNIRIMTLSLVSVIEEWQVGPIVRLLTLVFEIKEISVKQRKQESEKEKILNIFLPVLFNT